jgi:hypothetical protein
MTQKKIVEIALVDNSKKGYDSHIKLLLNNGETHLMRGFIKNGKTEVLEDFEAGLFDHVFNKGFMESDEQEINEWNEDHPKAEVIYKAA